MKKVIFFDLDSTLLQMNQDDFLNGYMKLIYNKIASLNIDPIEFINYFNKAVYMMINNDGNMTNEQKFWDIISKKYDANLLNNEFDKFYLNDFKKLKSIVNSNNISNDIIKYLKSKNYRLVLATNPLFPKICTYERIKWAGLDYNDFEYITTYDNSSYCKPNVNYYLEICEKLNISLSDIIMVGNDLSDDFSQLNEAVDKYLITDYLINSNNLEINMKSFTLNEFLNYIRKCF